MDYPLDQPRSMDTIESLRVRQTYLGGHDVAAVCGVHPYVSPLDVYNDKVRPIEGVVEPSEAMYWGQRLEDVILDELLRRMDAARIPMRITVRPAFARDPIRPFFGGTADAVAIVELGGVLTPAILEAKNVGPSQAAYWTREPPLNVQYQIQHYMLIHNCKAAFVAALINGREFRAFLVPRDELIIRHIQDRGATFWREHVDQLVPPPMDFATQGAETPSDETPGVEIADDPALAAALESMLLLKDTIKSNEERLAKAQAVLVDASNGLALKWKGKTIGHWSTTNRAAYTVQASTSTSFKFSRVDVIRRAIADNA